MPPTSRPPSLTISLRRAEIAAFWILATVMLSLVLGLASAALGSRAPWTWGAAGLGVLLPRVIWPQWFEIGVEVWNLAVGSTAAALRAYVLRVSYYLLFAALSGTGSSLDLVLRNAELSRWIPRAARDVASGDRDRLAAVNGWWGRELVASARGPGKAWVVFLLPVVLLLIVLREEGRESAPPSSTYSLY